MNKAKEIKVLGTEVVVQGNNFVDTQKNLSLQETKLFLFLISKIDPTQKDFSTCRISATEFAKVIGVENSSYIYRDLQAVTEKLLQRVVKMHDPEKQLFIQTHLIDSAHYWLGEGYVDIKISDDMKPHLLALKREFTRYKLTQITRMSSIYAIRIYEMLKKQEDFKQRQFFLDDLRKKLDISRDQYKKITDFQKRVLEIAKREINLKTDLSIDFEYIKAGRKIVAIKFNIKPKRSQADRNVSVTEDFKVIQELKRLGFSYQEASSMVYSVETCEAVDAINAVKDQIRKGNTKNPKAMAITAFRERWFAPAEENTIKKKPKKKTTTCTTGINKKVENGLISKLKNLFSPNNFKK